MTLGRVLLGLQLGQDFPQPAPAELTRALRSVEVQQTDTAPAGFQLGFTIETGRAGAFATAASSFLRPMTRVVIRVSVDGSAGTLMDGLITHHQMAVGDGPEPSVFVVTGEDVGVRMDQVEVAEEYPAFNDYLTVAGILARWAVFGLIPVAVPVPSSVVAAIDHTVQQYETDRAALLRLAGRNGCVFYVRPGPAPLTNYAYWGPPDRSLPPQAVLDVAEGPASNVERFEVAYDARVASRFLGRTLDTDVVPLPVPVVTLVGMRVPPFATRPSLVAGGLEGRVLQWRTDDPAKPYSAVDAATALLQAQAATDRSTDAVVEATVQTTTTLLGQVLSAPGVVAVRGSGTDHDGLYYLKADTHSISLVADGQWDYRQTLTLTREGLGSTISSVGA